MGLGVGGLVGLGDRERAFFASFCSVFAADGSTAFPGKFRIFGISGEKGGVP